MKNMKSCICSAARQLTCMTTCWFVRNHNDWCRVSSKSFVGATKMQMRFFCSVNVCALSLNNDKKTKPNWHTQECVFSDILWHNSLLPSWPTCQVMLWYLLVWFSRFVPVFSPLSMPVCVSVCCCLRAWLCICSLFFCVCYMKNK